MKRISWLAAAALLISSLFIQTAFAAEETSSEQGLDLTLRTNAAAMPFKTGDGSTLETPASHVYLIDYTTGTVLAEKAGDQKMYPSSMTKMMTLYMIFDRLKQGTLTPNSQFTVSEKAWRMQGSKMFVPLGGQIGLDDLIRGIAIQSGNDACVVVAEGIAGSEAAFATQMNETAKKIGMTHTNFVDASGWPSPDHVTTPHDLAMLANAIIRDFPQYYHYLSEREFSYHGIRQFNRNLLLGSKALNVDGLKTGHTDAAGYGITLSAKDGARRLILVVNGLASEADRASEGERLLSWGFHNFDNLTVFKAGQKIATTKVWGGKERTVDLVVAKDVVMSVPKVGRNNIKLSAEFASPLVAPVVKDKEAGKVIITSANGTTVEVPLVAVASVDKLSFFGRIPRAFGF